MRISYKDLTKDEWMENSISLQISIYIYCIVFTVHDYLSSWLWTWFYLMVYCIDFSLYAWIFLLIEIIYNTNLSYKYCDYLRKVQSLYIILFIKHFINAESIINSRISITLKLPLVHIWDSVVYTQQLVWQIYILCS